ncbi:hypothetical protein AVEN_37693-1 [Araneus ventricosus]|uniref:Uncharacterized protein n=1 Tax=Araneus ventricosus TaxID=182803 RepID=A0A4Y2TL41_ARAVE|nr:hypothetical protein AVEN_37693-1 [Araneus ventricosus]
MGHTKVMWDKMYVLLMPLASKADQFKISPTRTPLTPVSPILLPPHLTTMTIYVTERRSNKMISLLSNKMTPPVLESGCRFHSSKKA